MYAACFDRNSPNVQSIKIYRFVYIGDIMQPAATNVALDTFVQLLLLHLRIDICTILHVDVTSSYDDQPSTWLTLDVVVAAAAAHPNSTSLHYTPATDAWLSNVYLSKDTSSWMGQPHFGTEGLSKPSRMLCVHVLNGFLGNSIERNWLMLRIRQGRDLFRQHHLFCVDVKTALDDQFRASVLDNVPNAIVAKVQERTEDGRKQVMVVGVIRAVEFERIWPVAVFLEEMARNASEWR